MRSAVSSVPALPPRSKLHEFQLLLGQFVEARREGYRKLAEANARKNPIMAREAQQLLQQSEQTAAKLRALNTVL